MKPTIGRVVIYHTTDYQRKMMEESSCANVQEDLPAMVVAAWSEECVNLKVFVDGELPDMWITSAQLGNGEGQWEWPKIIPQTPVVFGDKVEMGNKEASVVMDHDIPEVNVKREDVKDVPDSIDEDEIDPDPRELSDEELNMRDRDDDEDQYQDRNVPPDDEDEDDGSDLMEFEDPGDEEEDEDEDLRAW